MPKLYCPSCGQSDIFTERMLSGLFEVKRGKEIQLEAWYCFDCGYQGIYTDFLPGAKRRITL